MAEIVGTQYNEVIDGTDADDTLIGMSGYDTLNGGEGSDVYIVNADDFQNRYVDFYNDTGASGTDVIRAAEAGVIIGLGDGFSLASTGIEAIEGLGGSTISGDNGNQVWDFTGVEITGVDLIFGMGGNDNITGTRAADVIDGGEGHDVLTGGRGNDTLIGSDGHDQLFGDNGRDTLEGGTGHDVLFGGNGRDFLTGGAGYDRLDGGNGADVYYVGLDDAGFVDDYNDTGTSGRDVIKAIEAGTIIGLINGFGPDSGIEVITSNRNADVTIGGTDDAEIWDFSTTRLSGIQLINALDGNDIIIGSAQRNLIDGGAGNDNIDGGAGNDVLMGGDGADNLSGGEGRDRLDGGAGNDSLDGGNGDDLYLFFADSNGGFDTITDSGETEKDKIIAQEDFVEIGLGRQFSARNGIEFITGARNDGVTIAGSDAGNNWDFTGIKISRIASIDSGDGMDVIIGNTQNNTINGEGGYDEIFGGDGSDTLFGGGSADLLFGEAGRDKLYGDTGHDVLDGGAARDFLFGGEGHDILIGGAGNDVLSGGEGYDIFKFGPQTGRDKVTDFSLADDRIDLSAFEGEIAYDDIGFALRDAGLVVKFGDSSVLLEDVVAEDLSADMFIL